MSLDGDRIEVCLNRCGVPSFGIAEGRSHVFGGKKAGAKIEIEFGRRVTDADLAPAVVLVAIGRVVEVQGMPAAAPAAVAAPRRDTANLELELLSAEVEPTKVRRGQSVALVAHFEIRGLAGGQQVPVTEERQLLLESSPLFAAAKASTQSWPAGRHSTRLELIIPPAATPGVYTFELTLRGAGREQRKSALFAVQE